MWFVTLRIRIARWLLPQGFGVTHTTKLNQARQTLIDTAVAVDKSGHLRRVYHVGKRVRNALAKTATLLGQSLVVLPGDPFVHLSGEVSTVVEQATTQHAVA